MTTREELKEAAKRLGMLAAEAGDFYDVVEAFSDGYALSRGDTETAKVILARVSALNELQSVANNTIRDFVADARTEHASWAQVGDALDMSKQGAQQRFGHAG